MTIMITPRTTSIDSSRVRVDAAGALGATFIFQILYRLLELSCANTNAAAERHCREQDDAPIRLETGYGCRVCAAFAFVRIAGGSAAATDWPSTNYDQTANRY